MPPPRAEPAAAASAPSAAPPKRKRRVGWIIAVVLLTLALLATGAVLALTFLQLNEANDTIEQQKELIDEKETFSAAMTELTATAGEYAGVKFGSLLAAGRLEDLAARGWEHRWSAGAMRVDTAEVRATHTELAAVLTAAREQAAANASGTTYEAVIDSLGGGFVAAVVDDADTLCEEDVLGCVMSDDPFTVHFDVADSTLEYMTDWLRTGLAYHEFAHVLQLTNPEATETTLAAFGGDHETMADCYALTFLDGWTLDHRIWVSDFQYWDVSIGYGYICDETQRQAVRDWVARLGIAIAPISQ